LKRPKIYADCYQAALHVFNRTKNFPKALRPTLGRQLEESCLSCLLFVRKASVSRGHHRLKHLYAASDALDDMRTLVQFGRDMQAINNTGFSELSALTKEIGKEIGGFIKHEQSGTPA